MALHSWSATSASWSGSSMDAAWSFEVEACGAESSSATSFSTECCKVARLQISFKTATCWLASAWKEAGLKAVERRVASWQISSWLAPGWETEGSQAVRGTNAADWEILCIAEPAAVPLGVVPTVDSS